MLDRLVEEPSDRLAIILGSAGLGYIVFLIVVQVEPWLHLDPPNQINVALLVVALVALSAGNLFTLIPQLLSEVVAMQGWMETLNNALALSVGAVGIFGLLCQDLYTQFGGFAGVHGSGDWKNFGWSFLASAFTFSAAQTYGWVTTPIQATALWSKTIIVLFSVIVDIILVGGIVNVIRTGIASFRGT